MSRLFLVPIISVFDVHDVAVRDWLNKLDEPSLHAHLEYPFRLERFFPESARHALMSVDAVHSEILRLLHIIHPQAVLLDISIDFIELEKKYNNRKISPLEFWSEYYHISAGMKEPLQAIYCIYIKGIIDKEIQLIENQDHLPFSVVFYGLPVKTREKLIPVYEKVLDKTDDFLLQIVRTVNEITSLREVPRHLWYIPMQERGTAISYEETDKFYGELLSRLERMLKYRVRAYIVKNLIEHAAGFLSAYEEFLENKIKEDEIKFSNILEGLSEFPSGIDDGVIFCGPMYYTSMLDALKKEKGLSELGFWLPQIDIRPLMGKMKPFIQKSRIMQECYDVALDILGRKKPQRYGASGTVLVPNTLINVSYKNSPYDQNNSAEQH